MRKCPFCIQEAKLSGEHLWSAWIGRILGKSGYAFRQRDSQGNIANQWKSAGLDLTAKAVCESCNNGWMSDLEESTKPILADIIMSGTKPRLDSAQRQIIAQFAFKNAVIADCTAKGRNPFFTTAARRKFKESLVIPGGIQMWLSHYRDPNGQSGFFLSRYHMLRGRNNPSNGFELYAFTFTAGFLALQVVASRWTNPLLIARYDEPVVTQDDIWNKVSVPFWPSTAGTLVCAPINSLTTQEDVYVFSARWQNMRVPFQAVAELGL
jgi:hypothetical protein